MNIFSRIFGSESVVEAGRDAIDKVFYTAEEKADQHAKFLKLYEPFKLAQRVIATIIIGPYMLAWLVVVVCSFSYTKEELAFPLELLSGDVGTAMLIIVGFYFAGGTLATLRK